MKPIIVIDLPLGMGIDREITEPYGYDLFYGDENIEAQWKKLEELRETGGVIIVQPSHTSAVREILNPYKIIGTWNRLITLARIVSSSRMGFAMTLMRLDLLLRRIHLALVSSTKRL